MIRFENDYSCGAHPNVLKWMIKTNEDTTDVYSEDSYCDQARELIRSLCQAPNAAVHFLPGGTMTNLTMIAASLLPYQGVISSSVGHIEVHETGAIEAKGHKVLTIPSKDGKITAEEIKTIYDSHYADASRERMVQPGMVYLTNPTEYGAIYTKEELAAISKVCRETELYLYVDGARLGYALTAEGNNLTLSDLAALCDAFYIGGTKHGALLGEALVITNDKLKKHFRYYIKQNGALLAKGRILGIQFLALFEDDIYFTTSQDANRKAMLLKNGIASLGYSFYVDSVTNQQFPILPTKMLEILSPNYTFSDMGKVDDTHSIARFCTNFATSENDIQALLADIAKIQKTL
ncbi:MAG: aminotransferase class I/II-fold pyridoxal phosphate-dependent enzyme [Clostridia bacterium]|nr:aminotransferase class I/II-fold pyridoxal phosphate-dependent enzyme [Clostridia bacterium]